MSKSFDETGTRAAAFGERLRQERETRGISLDEIAATTKIGTRLLRALEDEHFDMLPGGIFNKSYVRAYARHLGIDEEQAVAAYLKAAQEAPPDVRLIAHQNSSMHGDPYRYGTDKAVFRRGFPLIPVFVLLLVIVGAAGGWRLYLQRQRERQRPVRNVTAGLPSPTGQTAPSISSDNTATRQAARGAPPETSGVRQSPATSPDAANAAVRTVEAAESLPHTAGSDTSSLPASAQDATPFDVTIRAKDRARVEIKSDGKVLVRGVMNPADVKTIHATNKVVFWTANAGEVELSFNGKNVPLNGGQNDEQVLVFNSRGLLPRPAAQ